ncbi:MAG TPA: dihydrodipicolinate synthase family protein [Chloroflexota bacterium]|nr:dihydrodipicolinate synthase family protein [Chloroflexota bacterium]
MQEAIDLVGVRQALRRGLVIPAHPLALTASRRLDERRQRALTRYYLAAGAGGLAVGVHTTQFAIHEAARGLYRPVLDLAARTAREQAVRTATPPLLIAGIIGPTRQAVAEAELATQLGYQAGLLSLAALPAADDATLLAHCQAVAGVIPLFGFYLQPAVGGRALSRDFWRRFAAIEQVVAIKVAPFNRYQTLDVVRGVAESGRSGDIALYTGNDDHIVGDLLERYRLVSPTGQVDLHFVGGLLGQWAVWTKRAVDLLAEVRRAGAGGPGATVALLQRATAITAANAALFDAANGFKGCLPGIHEALRRQGLLDGRWCLDPDEEVSPGQLAEIDSIHAAYPDLRDDAFVAEHLDEWLR